MECEKNMSETSSLIIGLMSGTSLDGVDGVLADFAGVPAAKLTDRALVGGLVVAAAGAALAGGTMRSGTPPSGVPILPDAASLFAASDVAIDFTHASAAAEHAALAAESGTPLVLGTSGLSAAQEAAVAEAARRVPIVYAANFAPGVNLVLAIAERMAAALPPDGYDAEIVEMHHRQKVDAPSGTAVALGRAVARGRGTTLEAAGVESGRDGHTGARKTGTIGFAALRGALQRPAVLRAFNWTMGLLLIASLSPVFTE